MDENAQSGYPRAATRIGRIEKVGVVATLRLWRQRSRSRAELAAMDEFALHDLGMMRTQAAFEAAKPFWRA